MTTNDQPMSKNKKVISAGFLLQHNGEYLIGLPSGRTGTTGGWGIPKGKQDAGESLLGTALREFWEETSFEIRNESLEGNVHYEEEPFYSYNVESRDGDKTVFAFRAYVTSKKVDEWIADYPFKCLTNLNNGLPEIAEYKWVTPAEAVALVVKSQKAMFEFIHKYRKIDDERERRRDYRGQIAGGDTGRTQEEAAEGSNTGASQGLQVGCN
jgi:8-oxo-dGTP pyrophosphatase MutT (NUDIX family)